MTTQNQVFTDGNGNTFVMQNGQLVQVQPAGQNQQFVPQNGGVPQQQVFGSGFNTMIQGVILGHLGADPEFRTAPNGRLCCNFRVAINRVYTVGEGPQAQTVNKKSWLKVACFGKRAEKQQGVLRKGSWVLVPFSWVDVKSYQDKQFPQITRTSTEFHADKVIWLFKKEDNAYSQQPGQQQPFVPAQPQGQQFVQPGQQFVQQPPAQQYNPQGGYQPFPQQQAAGEDYSGM
jgi:single-strand DNA-binding protein